MMNLYRLYFRDSEPRYGGWCSISQPIFATDHESAYQVAEIQGWSLDGIKMVIY